VLLSINEAEHCSLSTRSTWPSARGESLRNGSGHAQNAREEALLFTNLKSGEGIERIANFIIEKGGLAKNAALALRFMSPGFDI